VHGKIAERSPLDKEIQAAVIGAVAGIGGALVGGIAAWFAARSTNRIQQKLAEDAIKAHRLAFIDSLVLKLSEFRMEHPHLEKDEFCQSYPNVPGNPNGKERYEAYCCFVFNMLMMAFKHFSESGDKLADYIGIEEIIRCHHKWWLHDKDNLGYDEPFRQCIQTVIDRLRKAEKIK